MIALVGARAFALSPRVEIFVENPLRPTVHGSTNLPDGTSLIVSLARSASSYMGQSTVTVEAGRFVSEKFSQGNAPLNPGLYDIDVSMSDASFQSADVQAVIGKLGQNLRGRLVTSDSLGGGHGVDYKTTEHLGGAPDAASDEKAREQATVDLHAWTVKSCAESVDIPNAGLAAGLLTGRPIVGADRQAAIDDCIRQSEHQSAGN